MLSFPSKRTYTLTLKFLIVATLTIVLTAAMLAQNLQQFSVSNFEADPFDYSAKDKKFEKFDGNGDRYAIIKVNSTNPSDNLTEYNFNFGNLKHVVENHDGILWIYVQKNAKIISITRDGFAPVNRHDLHTTIESGKNYIMTLSSQPKKIQRQMIVFKVTPANSKAFVTIKNILNESSEEPIGTIDETGSVAKNLPLGTYSYKILSNNYQTLEGLITLNDKSQTLIEEVSLSPNFSSVTLKVDMDAQIFVDDEFKGVGEWTGLLKAGVHQIDCRKEGHQPTSQIVHIENDNTQTVILTSPMAIMGTVSVFSNPLGASILIDGKKFGETPRNIELPIGKHSLEMTKSGYKPRKLDFMVTEDDSSEIKADLEGQNDIKNAELTAEDDKAKNKTGKPVEYGVPLVLDLTIDNYGVTESGNEFNWKDGTTLFLSCTEKSNCASKGETMYARYSSNDGWILYNFNNEEFEDLPLHQVICVENMHADPNTFIKKFKTWLFYSESTEAGYIDRYMSDNKMIGDQSSCSFKNGKFYLSSKLKPLYGKVRFAANSLPTDSVEYNHATYCIKGDSKYGFKGYANDGTPVSRTRKLNFHKGNDGKYYSDYVYARAIPELRIGSLVYRYNSHRTIPQGQAETIELPNRKALAYYWTAERYFTELKTPENSYQFDPGEPIYIDLENLNLYRTIRELHAKSSKYMSSAGLTVCVDYEIELTGNDASADMYLNIDNGTPDYKRNYFEGVSNSYRHITKSTQPIRGRMITHCCNDTSLPHGFYPYLKLIPNAYASGVLKIKRIRISDFD